MSILSVHARQILHCRGNPTVEVDISTNKGIFRASSPGGPTSVSYLKKHLRDQNETEYHGNGVSQAVRNVNEIIGPQLIDKNFIVTNQQAVDEFLAELDGTDDKSRLGVNALLPVSLAVCRAGAAHKGVPLYRHIADLAGKKDLLIPVPGMSLIVGGTQSNSNLPVQEILVFPTGAESFSDALRMGCEIQHELKILVTEKYGSNGFNTSYTGGLTFNSSVEEAFTILAAAIQKAGYTDSVSIGMDVAASKFSKDGLYDGNYKNLTSSKDALVTPGDLMDFYTSLNRKFKLSILEDPFSYQDWDFLAKIHANGNMQIVGDDLVMDYPGGLKEVINKGVCNSILLKIGKCGSVTSCIETSKIAENQGWCVIASHCSSEVNDTFIADLAVGLCAGQIKAGGPCCGERVAKYNQLLRIEEDLGEDGKYAGSIIQTDQSLNL